MNKNIWKYIGGLFIIWSLYTLYIFSFNIWIRQVLIGLASILLFFLFFGILYYALKK